MHTRLNYLTPDTLFAVRKWQMANLTNGGGHYMSFEMLRYGLFVPDNSAFAYSFSYSLN